MKSSFIICLFSLLSSSLICQEYFTVNVAVAQNTVAGTGDIDANNSPKKGADFVLSGIVYPGDYFENHCPDAMNCGINLIQTADTLYAEPQHSMDAIGRWDMNAFTIRDVEKALENGGVPTFSTQIFTFRNDFDACPGCLIITEGKDLFGNTENVSFKRSISGGTTEEFRSMRGEVEQIILKQADNLNDSGGYNMIVTFYFEKN